MSLLVQKFGGTSVANIDRIKTVAKRTIKTFEAGHKVVVVLSAMAGETDRLIGLAHDVSERPDEREFDALLSSGEQVSISILAMAIREMGYKARSLLAHQIRIVTDDVHTKARIMDVETERIKNALNDGVIAVVAGFQGVNEERDITTLGRSGSDTTAVALAVALKADICEIYTDVNGVYTTDPNICSDARKLKKISYDEMLEMASMGAKVLQTRSVEFAKKYGITLMVRSSFNEETGNHRNQGG